MSPPTDFESVTSTNSITPAQDARVIIRDSTAICKKNFGGKREESKNGTVFLNKRVLYYICIIIGLHLIQPKKGAQGMKREKALLLAIAMLWVLCGCGADTSGEGLYRLPRLPGEYESLEQQIDALLASGAEHAAPTSGSNLQSVQMVDLDGDNVEEAVALMRKNDDEKPMKIYIFRTSGDNYEPAYQIEGTSEAIYSIAYYDLNGDGYKEILTGFRSNLDMQSLSVISLSTGKPVSLLTTGYFRYIACDMDGNGEQELVVIRSDEENRAFADCYTCRESLELQSSLGLSMTAAEVNRLTSGTLANGDTALFVTGIFGEGGEITDILSLRDGQMQNIGTCVPIAGEAARFATLYPTDIDGDGITEVPEPVAFPKVDPEGETYYRIFWQQYDEKGNRRTARCTLHNMQDGWCLVLPEKWDDTLTVSRQGTADSNTVFFFNRSGSSGEAKLSLEIGTFTGDTREYQAVRDGRFLLAQQADAVYSAKIYDESAISEETLRASFSLLAAEWTTGEN